MWRALNSDKFGECGPAGSGWDQVVAADRCATSEGWADFFATAMHYGPNASAPIYQWNTVTTRLMEGDLLKNSDNNYPGGGLPDEPCVGGTEPHMIRGNVARYFWDIYDNTTIDDAMTIYVGWPVYQYYYNVNRDGLTSPTLATIVAVWDEFPLGTGERDADEYGYDGVVQGGRNIWDFDYHLDRVYSYDSTSIAELNCVDGQSLY